MISHPKSTNSLQTEYIPHHVHLVGSSPFATNTEFFKHMSTAFPHRLLTIPDGETGKRNFFVRWQLEVFAESPHILKGFQQIGDYTQHEADPNASKEIKMKATGYDDFAIESYKEFCKLRREGVIEQGVRFQVSLPTPVNVIGLCLLPEFYAEAEPMYEKGLLSALRRIQDEIPADDLAIQWDMAYEIGMLELPVGFTSWFDGPIMDGIVERITRLAKAVDPGVKIGFHLCYGDAGHKHFVESEDLGVLVEIINQISGAVERQINWFHVPVPKDRTDEAYFSPLMGLKLKRETEMILGLAHAWDVEGTRKRIQVASPFLTNFGISTECGLGRSEKEEVEIILGVLAKATESIQPEPTSLVRIHRTLFIVSMLPN
ncbi:hypothetical protein LSUE1_G003061 [Lachnellula suecica]|uniref:Uncharacterized protein n=1 Tax=Lachnellula suecica TaxID=602035 RepID=A0A8T9CEF7_9HELO|nr:hypothetical protein LSUE1_G003061 [Lachnellula suecica]